MSTRHENLTYVHVPYNWSYADAAAREAAVGLEETDIGKLALQEDDWSLWMLVDDYPTVTWISVGSATALHTDETGEIAGLTGKDTPVGADMVLIEDSAASNAKKKVLLSNLLKIISGLTEQESPADEDLVVIQEASGGALKKVEVQNLAGGGGGFTTGDIHEVELYRGTLAEAGNFDVSSISQDYDHLLIRARLRSSTSDGDGDNVVLFFNNDSTAGNYRGTYWFPYSGGAASGTEDNACVAEIAQADQAIGVFSPVDISIPNYASTTFVKMCRAFSEQYRGAGGDAYFRQYNKWWEGSGATAINRVTIQPDGYSTDKFAAGSFLQIIGIKTET